MPNIRSSDRGSFNEVGLLSLTVTSTDPCSGLDVGFLNLTHAASDSGSATSIAQVTDPSIGPATDSGTANDTSAVVTVVSGPTGSPVETGTASETTSIVSTGLAASDAGTALEAQIVDPAGSGGGGGGGGGSAGDNYASPIVLTGTSGTLYIDFSSATVETGEPDTGAGDANTVWVKYTPSSDGYFTFATIDPTFETIIEQYDPAASVDLLAPANLTWDGAPNYATLLVSSGVTYYFRAYPAIAGSSAPATAISASYSFSPQTTADITLTNTNLDWTPGNLICNVGNVDPNATVVFNVNGTDVLSTTSDDSGVVYNCSVPVPALNVGIYNITATCGVESVTNTFSVNLGQLSGSGWSPATPPSPSYTPPSDPVQYWVLFDETPGGETYTFERNPLEMTPLYAPRPLTVDTTTAWDGQAITWEASKKASNFSFSGTLTSQTQLEALERFGNLNRRVWLIDHNKQAWLITVEHVDAVPVIKVNADFAHTYQVDCLCFFGPVSL